ncbi:MAG: outer membrane lipid asymmetry maintenance protein MlaD [Deltaproteobacteria bacterium]|nr:outer membrane lipid asymmetry maintenance protein MlaD [Deltaproteobacteria bacterium]
MKNNTLATTIGLFVFIGLLCVGYLTIRLGKVEWFGGETYRIHARFSSVSGLKKGGAVEIAGVQVGQVDEVDLDQERMAADVWMKIRKGVKLDEEVIASIKTAGLIGDKYIKLTPGGSERLLGNGGAITETEPVMDIEELIGKYVFGSAEN